MSYKQGLIDAQAIADRIAGNDKDFDKRTRQGAGMVSAELRAKIEKQNESAATAAVPTSDV